MSTRPLEVELQIYMRVQQVSNDTALWCGGSSTSKSFLAWPEWPASDLLYLPLLLVLRDSSVEWDLYRLTCWGRLLDTNRIDLMWAKYAPLNHLERDQARWHTNTHSHTHYLLTHWLTHTCTHFPLCLTHQYMELLLHLQHLFRASRSFNMKIISFEPQGQQGTLTQLFITIWN